MLGKGISKRSEEMETKSPIAMQRIGWQIIVATSEFNFNCLGNEVIILIPWGWECV
jgi:hypothetical protein